MRLIFPIVLLALVVACGDGNGYRTDRADDAYDLEAMLLTFDDLPLAMEEVATNGFDNAGWSQLFDVDDFDVKRTQLDARGRIVNAIRIFSWTDAVQHLGESTLITAQSTLYEDEEAAHDSLELFCGIPVDDSTAPETETFWVDGLGDESSGFFMRPPAGELGRLVDTVVCFRTGRIVHAVVQNALAGSEDVALAVRLARRMLERVDVEFEDL